MEDSLLKIGNCIIDLKDYKGTDLYSDGDVEDELLKVAMHIESTQFEEVIKDNMSWPYIYHLSPDRGNVLEWVPISNQESVLEIGSGCGAITGTIAKKAKKVTCVELSKKRSLINANRNRNYDNIEILVGNFEDVESRLDKFDVITLIGVFEYAGFYINSENPYKAFLKKIKKHLNENGRIIIAIENKFGLKYFAGCKEDHVGMLFEGIEGYNNTNGIRTFSKPELLELSRQTGFSDCRFFYPYPDYKLPYYIYSDKRMPQKGELNQNLNNYDSERMLLFNESLVFDEIINDKIFDYFSNSFVVILSEHEHNTKYPNYVKYNRRTKEYNIKTSQIDEDNVSYIIKAPQTSESKKHIETIEKNYHLLKSFYCENEILLNRFINIDGILQFEFIQGETFEKQLDNELFTNGYEKALGRIKAFFGIVKGKGATVPFVKSEEFVKVFGDVDTSILDEKMQSIEVTNVDLIFSNVIINDKWNLIDYEWVFTFPIPFEFVIYRSIKNYTQHNKNREFIQKRLLDDFGITEAMIIEFDKMDKSFMRYVLGCIPEYSDALSLRVDEVEQFQKDINRKRIDLYFELIDGTEKHIKLPIQECFCDAAFDIKLNIPDNAKSLRIDPVEQSCIISSLQVFVDSEEKDNSYFLRGYKLKSGKWFLPYDPQINILNLENHKTVECRFGIDTTGKVLLNDLADNFKNVTFKTFLLRYSFFKTIRKIYVSTKHLLRGRIQMARDTIFEQGQGLDYNYISMRIEDVEYQKNNASNKFSIAVIVVDDGINSDKLYKTLNSISNQTYAASAIKVIKFDQTHFICNICEFVNEIGSDYFALIKVGDELCMGALWTIARILLKRDKFLLPSMIYTDEKEFNFAPSDSNRFIFKPDFSHDTLMAQNYIGRFGLFSKEYILNFAIQTSCFDEFVYTQALNIDNESLVLHVNKAIYYSSISSKRIIDNNKYARIVQSFLNKRDIEGTAVSTDTPGVIRIKYKIEQSPKISIIIPNKDSVDTLNNCIQSILNKSTYSNYEIIIVENNSIQKETFKYYDDISKINNVSVCNWEGGWNYSAINNFAVKYSDAEYIVLLNNDVEIIEESWLEEMLMFAQREDVGIVGGKLLYPDGTIQHAGVTIGIRGIAGHAFHQWPGDTKGYMNRCVSTMNLSAVTFACAMMPRKIFNELNGLNEKYAVAFNDVDMCLRARSKGYHIVYTPYALLYHFESKTRGLDNTPEKQKRFSEECNLFYNDWGKVLQKGDPYYNKNLSLDDDDFKNKDIY